MDRSRFLIAVFDDWDALGRVLSELEAETTDRAAALLHERKDAPADGTAVSLVRHTTELHFSASMQRVHCTTGGLAKALAGRLADGAHSLADALRAWLTGEQARELEHHVASGRLVLWVRPVTPADFETVCARLVQATPHLVALSMPGPGP
jgi:hypothetical protein